MATKQENETQFVFDGDGRPVVEKQGSRLIASSTPDPMTVAVTGYQVWSTVLGSALTTVDPEGDKKEMRVFAGGALIARQNANGTTSTGDDHIEFTTSDRCTRASPMESSKF